MGKVVITQEQADKIKGWECHSGYPSSILLRFHAQNKLSDDNCLRSLTLDELARCLYGEDYEVEDEFKVGDWVVYNNNPKIITEINRMGEDALVWGNFLHDGGHFCAYKHELRHATESEIVEEEKRCINKKLDKILLDLSEYEQDMLYKRFECGR